MKRTILSFAISAVVLGCLGKTTSLGSAEDAATIRDAGPAEPIPCGENTCTGGQICCDSSCGICAGPDEGCAATACTGDPRDGGGSADGGSNAICEAHPALAIAPCPNGEYCVADADGTCGSGHCKSVPPPPPPFCPSLECGCDGVVRCADTSPAGGSDVDDGKTACRIACGTTTCDGVTEYCEHAYGGIATPDGGTNEWWTCRAVPPACETDHSCACMNNAPGTGATSCVSDKDGKLTVDAFLP